MKNYYRLIVSTIVIALLLFPFFYFVTIYYQSYSFLRNLRPYEPYLATKLFDSRGELISELYDENRSVITIDRLPRHVPAAFIVTEDRDFFRHPGFDTKSILRAIIVDALSGELRQGGSTITQQLVKRLYTSGERSFRRKIIELLIAREFERRYTKEQILEMYLNLIYFGHGAHGINSAARFYFNCGAESLNLYQATILASLTTAPNRNSPIRNPGAAYLRSREIFHAMQSAGFAGETHSREQFDAYWKSYLDETKTRYATLGVRNWKSDRAPYFTEHVRKILIKKYGPEKVYRSGMKIYTTVDLRAQETALRIMKKGLARQNAITGSYNQSIFRNFDHVCCARYMKTENSPPSMKPVIVQFYRTLGGDIIDSLNLLSGIFCAEDIEETCHGYTETYQWFRSSGRAEGALVALDHHTGAIIALIGGSGFHQGNQLNRATQAKRQPGSAFKIFIYGAGIVSGLITAATTFFDINNEEMEPEVSWRPRNYDKKSRGLVSVRKAMALSLNTIPVQVYNKIGGARITDYASRLLGIPTQRFETDPTLALGTTEVTPLELARGTSVYANGGYKVVPHSIVRIEDRKGTVIYDADYIRKKQVRTRLIPESAAFIMTSLMKDVVERGTAYYAVKRVAAFRLPAAGKTGSNTSFRDAWFAGFTGNLTAVVWVGCDIPRFSLGNGQSGAATAAPLWGQFMREVSVFRDHGKFRSMPDDVIRKKICRITGNILVPGCPGTEELFLKGTEPKERCSGEHQEDETI
jgi:penicillin-binding protein 1A